MGKNYYDYVGEFIYSVRRHGGDLHDINNWMADDLGVARPPINDDSVQSNLYSDFFSKYSNEDEFRENLARFVEIIKSRALSVLSSSFSRVERDDASQPNPEIRIPN